MTEMTVMLLVLTIHRKTIIARVRPPHFKCSRPSTQDFSIRTIVLGDTCPAHRAIPTTSLCVQSSFLRPLHAAQRLGSGILTASYNRLIGGQFMPPAHDGLPIIRILRGTGDAASRDDHVRAA